MLSAVRLPPVRLANEAKDVPIKLTNEARDLRKHYGVSYYLPALALFSFWGQPVFHLSTDSSFSYFFQPSTSLPTPSSNRFKARSYDQSFASALTLTLGTP